MQYSQLTFALEHVKFATGYNTFGFWTDSIEILAFQSGLGIHPAVHHMVWMYLTWRRYFVFRSFNHILF